MPLKTWSSAHSVGVNQLDDDHRMIFAMINKLYDAMSTGQGKTIIEKLLSDMRSYSLSHFKNEETYLENIKYPYIAEQKTQHAAFMNKVDEFETEYKKGNMTIATKIMPFLSDWLSKHIMTMDMRYSTITAK